MLILTVFLLSCGCLCVVLLVSILCVAAGGSLICNCVSLGHEVIFFHAQLN